MYISVNPSSFTGTISEAREKATEKRSSSNSTNHTQMESDKSDRELKRLRFVKTIAGNTFGCISNLYKNAKQRTPGPLKSAVAAAESTVTAVFAPVYEKFKGVPDDLLAFVDDKVDGVAKKLDVCVPTSVKQLVNKAQSMGQKASEGAHTLLQKAQAGAGTAFMQSFLPAVVKIWFAAEQYPPLRLVAQLALPTVSYSSESYNKTIAYFAGKGFPILGRFPQIPTAQIVKIYEQQIEEGKRDAPAAEQLMPMG